MSIRLSGAQIIHLRESLCRFEDNFGKIPPKLRYEDLVEDIFRIVTPEVSEWLINAAPIPKEPQNASDLSRS
jgi:hypothetical protein